MALFETIVDLLSCGNKYLLGNRSIERVEQICGIRAGPKTKRIIDDHVENLSDADRAVPRFGRRVYYCLL